MTQNHNRRRLLPLYLLLAVAVLAAIAGWYQHRYRAYSLSIDGAPVGIVRSSADVDTALAMLNDEMHASDGRTFYRPKLAYEPTFAKDKNCMDADAIQAAIQSNATACENAWVLRVRGTDVAAMRDRDELLDVLSTLKSSLIKTDPIVYESKVLSLDFLEPVEITYAPVSSALVYPKEGLLRTLLAENARSRVAIGPRPTTGSGSGSTTFREVRNLPGVYLSSASPLSLDCLLKMELYEKIKLPHSTIFHYDETLAAGERIVEREGVDGRLFRLRETQYINGQPVQSKILKETLALEPVSAIVRVGDRKLVERMRFRMPARGVISSPYGPRFDGFHRGIDIAGSIGDDVTAAADGIVRFAGFQSSYGYCVFLDHKDGYQTRYAHLLTISVREGDSVRTGESLGRMGSSGNSTGAHVHFEVLKNGETLDPEEALR